MEDGKEEMKERVSEGGGRREEISSTYGTLASSR